MSSNASTSTGVELEMSRRQRELVNNCWEENQYDAGIAILDQLRSPRHRPSVDHIRQLVFIALHSSTPTIPNPADIHASPSKMTKRERFQLKPNTVNAARRVLLSFALTNTPEGMLSAIPSHNNNDLLQSDDEDSVLARESLRVNRAKSCWDLIKSDFIKGPDVPALSRTSTRCRSTRREEEDDILQVVGDDAWTLLEWLITIFEKEENSVQSGEPRYSQLLLSQIPPERSGKDARWDDARILDIVFYAIQQEEDKYCRLGIRLLNLLVNLSGTIYLDFALFITAMSNLLSTSSREVVEKVLSLLPPSQSVVRFKVSLCQRLLGVNNSSTQRGGIRPKAQPKPRGSAAMPAPAPAPAKPTITRKFVGPSTQDVFELVKVKVKSDTLPILRLRYELLLSYSLLQSQSAANEQDQEWKVKQDNGELGSMVEETFIGKDGEGSIYREMLQAMVCVR